MRSSRTGGMPLLHKRPAIYALVGLTLVAVALIAGVFSLSPRQQAGAADAGTALDFASASSQRVTFGTALGRSGTAVAAPAWVPGQFGNGLQFNGSTQYVTFGAAPGLGASSFTIETWFNWTGGGTNAQTGSGGLTAAIPLVTKGRNENENSNVDMNYFLGIDVS